VANPYLILIALVGAIGLFFSGVSIGYKYEKNAHLAALATSQDAIIKTANAIVDSQVQLTVAAAKAEADTRIKSAAIRNKGELDAMSKSRPQCGRDSVSMGLLNDAIDTANGQSRTPSVVLNPVRPSPLSGGWLGVKPTSMGLQNDGILRPVPTPTQ
jgi:hypothetical protein